jgi:hypothetical protein
MKSLHGKLTPEEIQQRIDMATRGMHPDATTMAAINPVVAEGRTGVETFADKARRERDALRARVLDDRQWRGLSYPERVELCRQAQVLPHEPDIMRFDLYRSMVPREFSRDRSSPAGKRYNSLSVAATKARKALSPERAAYWEQCREARMAGGWTQQGDRAVWAVPEPVQDAREAALQAHVEAGTLPEDPMPGERSTEAVALRRRAHADRQEVKRRLAAKVKTDEQAARDDREALAIVMRELASAAPLDPTAAARLDALRRHEAGAAQYAKSYALRAAEDLALILRMGRPCPIASRHRCGDEVMHRRPRFYHSDRGSI